MTAANVVIIVTFNCGNDFEFHQKKYEECFKNYEKLVLFDKGVRNIVAVKKIPEAMAQKYNVIGYAFNDNVLTVA